MAGWPTRSKFLSCLVATGAACAVTPSAQAQEAPALSFNKAELAKTCTELKERIAIEVRNETSTRQEVGLTFSLFADQDGALRTADRVCGGLTTDPASLSLAAGASGLVTVKADLAVTNGKSFTGSLAASATRAAVRLPMKLAAKVPKPAKTRTPATPLAASIADTAYRGQEYTYSVWVPVKVRQGKEVALIPRATLGVVSGAAGRAAVVYAGELKRLSAGTSLLKAYLVGLKGIGSYEGTLDLLPEDKDKGNVTLKLTYKDGIVWPIVALLSGLGLALFSQRLAGVAIARRRLRARLAATGPRYAKARHRLVAAAAGASWAGFALKDLGSKRKEISEAIEAEAHAARTALSTAKVDGLSKQIDELEKEIDLIDSVPTQAKALSTALSDVGVVEGVAPQAADVPAEPALATKARPLLIGEQMTVANLKTRLKDIEQAAATLSEIHGYLLRISRYEWRLGQLKTRLPAKRTEVEAAQLTLGGAKHNIWTATEPAQLVGLKVAADIDDVGRKVGAWWAELEADEERRSTIYGEALLELAAAEGRQVERSATEPEPEPEAEPINYTESGVRYELEAARMAQRLLVGLAVVLALVTGMTALYVGKPFGSIWDYILAVTWGLGAQATVMAVATALDALGGLNLIGRRVRSSL